MKRSGNFISALLGLLLLVALGGGLAAMLRGASSTRGDPGISPLATSTALQSPLSTPTPVYTPSPAPTATPVVIPPPPNWPTDEPWPPLPTTPNIPSSKTPAPFATPSFAPQPQGTPPNQLQLVWYLQAPNSASSPQLQAVTVDRDGQRWGESAAPINLSLRPEFPGPSLIEIIPAPDHSQLVGQVAYGESVRSVVIDPGTGATRSIAPEDNSITFLAWKTNGQRMLVSSHDRVKLLDLASTVSTTVDFPREQYGPYLNAAAYSLDGAYLADAVVYPATLGVRDREIAEIGLREGERGERASLIQIPGGVLVGPNTLMWSPLGNKLSWVVNIVPSGTLNIANMQTQLWVFDVPTKQARVIATLAQGTEYKHVPAWSPDGRYIAYIKEGASNQNDAYLFEIESGSERRITGFGEQRVSHLVWSPSAQLLAFNLSTGDHGEIWITDLQGTNRRAIAGPTLNGAPFVWCHRGNAP